MRTALPPQDSIVDVIGVVDRVDPLATFERKDGGGQGFRRTVIVSPKGSLPFWALDLLCIADCELCLEHNLPAPAANTFRTYGFLAL